MDFLREDLTHLFDDQGIDQSQYDAVVRGFSCPCTLHASVQLMHAACMVMQPRSHAHAQVQFRDPITSYNDAKGVGPSLASEAPLCQSTQAFGGIAGSLK